MLNITWMLYTYKYVLYIIIDTYKCMRYTFICKYINIYHIYYELNKDILSNIIENSKKHKNCIKKQTNFELVQL